MIVAECTGNELDSLLSRGQKTAAASFICMQPDKIPVQKVKNFYCECAGESANADDLLCFSRVFHSTLVTPNPKETTLFADRVMAIMSNGSSEKERMGDAVRACYKLLLRSENVVDFFKLYKSCCVEPAPDTVYLSLVIARNQGLDDLKRLISEEFEVTCY